MILKLLAYLEARRAWMTTSPCFPVDPVVNRAFGEDIMKVVRIFSREDPFRPVWRRTVERDMCRVQLHVLIS